MKLKIESAGKLVHLQSVVGGDSLVEIFLPGISDKASKALSESILLKTGVFYRPDRAGKPLSGPAKMLLGKYADLHISFVE